MKSTTVDIAEELTRHQIAFRYVGEQEVQVLCPRHPDTTPSACINTSTGIWNCHTAGCKGKGDFPKFLSAALHIAYDEVVADLSTRYQIGTTKCINPDLIEKYHGQIWAEKLLLHSLYARGITDDDIRNYRLGASSGTDKRITIPIMSAADTCVNLRRYLPDAPKTKAKIKNQPGHGQIALFPLRQLEYQNIVLCGGEIKAIATARLLNPHGIGAITATAGEGNWSSAFNKKFHNKNVWICFDVDSAGTRASKVRAKQFSLFTDWVGILDLPLDKEEFPHGDINDFIMVAADTATARILDLMQRTPRFVDGSEALVDLTPERTDFGDAVTSTSTNKRIEVDVVVSAIGQAPFIVPSKLLVECLRDQDYCSLCPVHSAEDGTIFDLGPESLAILEIVGANSEGKPRAIKRALSIPDKCRSCDFCEVETYTIEEARVSPRLEMTSTANERFLQPAVVRSQDLELNASYRMTGRLYPNPKTQESCLLFSEARPLKDTLTHFELDGVEELRFFSPEEWSVGGIQARLDAVYADLEANVTRIYNRRNLHLTVDLAYHSPLLFEFDGKVEKGWAEVLILGDSAQGKSETTLNMMRHYGVGEKVECKNASVAGLLGGLQQFGTKWLVTWGVIPTHDRRLVVLEELKGANPEVISRLTDMRSSGIAEIPKIEKRKTHARTRLIALSNPRSDMPLASYNYGIDAIKELVGGLEDVRRFDFALLLSSEEIDPQKLNAILQHRPRVEHRHTSELCRRLVLWSWTRAANQVLFPPESQTLILDEAARLQTEFSDAIPLIDRGSTRYKIARLSAALAARTFSATADGTSLVVQPCHIEYVVSFIQDHYSTAIFGYRDFSRAQKTQNEISNPEEITTKLNTLVHARDFIENMLYQDRCGHGDLQDWSGSDRLEAQELSSFLVRKRALRRDGRFYRKTPGFIELLKGMLEGGKIVEETVEPAPTFVGTDERMI